LPYSNQDIDTKLEALKSSITETNAARAGADARVDAAIAALTAKIDTNARLDDEKLDALKERIPTTPWWINPLFAAALALASSWYFDRRNRADSDRRRRTDAAISLCDQWADRQKLVANALFLLKDPARLVIPSEHNVVIDHGNWLERLAQRWRANLVDQNYLERQGFLERAREFWTQFERAKQTLDSRPGNTVDLSIDQQGWPNLSWLAGGSTKVDQANAV
jgi:hypothetical protein